MRRLGPLTLPPILSRGRDLIKIAWHDPKLLPPEMEQYYLKPFKVNNWDKALWEFTLASQSTSLMKRLAEMTLPELVVTGDDDRIVPTKDSLLLAHELPNASLEVISDAGHLPHEDRPKAFIEVVTRFMVTVLH